MKAVGPILLAFFLFSSAFGQTKREWIEYGDDAFDREDYLSAASYYRMVFDDQVPDARKQVRPYKTHRYSEIEKGDSNDLDEGEEKELTRSLYVTRRVAKSYLFGREYDEALEWYEKLVEEEDAFPEDRLYYAQALIEHGEYDKASEQLEKVMMSGQVMDQELMFKANILTGSCDLASRKELENKEVVVRSTKGAVNEGLSDMAPRFTDEIGSLLFSSARLGNTVGDKEDPEKGRYTTDLYLADKGSGSFDRAERLEGEVNSEHLEGAAAMSSDGQRLYFTRCDKDEPGDCGIYLSRNLGGNWLKPMLMNENVNVEGSSSKHPVLGQNENVLFFTSDRSGGEGGMDIWYVPLDARGLAGEAVNLGFPVNTPGDELAPFYSDEAGILFFSSDGHPGLGGMDIFKSHGKDSSWSDPTNLQAPVNSTKDELYYVLDEDLDKGHFTSDRSKCDTCEESNYCYDIYEFEGKPKLFTVQGYVYDQETDEPISNSLVTIKDVKEELEPIYVTTDEDGFYQKQLLEGVEYFLKAQKVDYFGDANSLSTKGLSESKDFQKDFFLERIPEDEVKIEGIYYDLDKATLRDESKAALDILADFLELNDNLVVEIRAHTDVRGSADYNMDLSDRRAQSVVDYLVNEKGIDPERLVAEGYGESEPKIENAQSEEEHQENRRTTFKTLRQDYRDIER